MAKPDAGKRRELLALTRELPHPQRDYLECMTTAAFHTGNAHRGMLLKGYVHDKSTYTRWRGRPKMARALELAEELALEAAGITASKIIGNVNRISEHGLDEIQLRDETGALVFEVDAAGNKIPVMMMRDPKLALKANELLGKNKRLWSDEDSTRVTVQIVDLSGQMAARAPLDGEFTAVEDDN